MNKLSIANGLKKIASALVVIIAALVAASCEAVYDDLEACPSGLSLRFVYDYNMVGADLFPQQVDCLTLLVYDSEGVFKGQYKAGRAETSTPGWRMTVPLPAGSYRLIAWGGVGCDDASSFAFAANPATVAMDELSVTLPDALLSEPEGADLHPLFYGSLDITMEAGATDYTPAVVTMMKDTNNLEVTLISASGAPLDASDFIFTVTGCDNTTLNYLNEPVSPRDATYYPWTTFTRINDPVEGGNPYGAAGAEFSLSRLTADSDARLNVLRRSDGTAAVSIPLVDILLLLRSSRFDYMGSQEFLDRQSDWSLTFVLGSNQSWMGTSIVINGWVVRINDIPDLL